MKVYGKKPITYVVSMVTPAITERKPFTQCGEPVVDRVSHSLAFHDDPLVASANRNAFTIEVFE
jgi:predicted RNase H-like nuclease